MALQIISVEEQDDVLCCRLGHTFEHVIYGCLNFSILVIVFFSFVLFSIQGLHPRTLNFIVVWGFQFVLFFRLKEIEIIVDSRKNDAAIYRTNILGIKNKATNLLLKQISGFAWMDEKESAGFKTGIPCFILKDGRKIQAFERVFEHEMNNLVPRIDKFVARFN